MAEMTGDAIDSTRSRPDEGTPNSRVHAVVAKTPSPRRLSRSMRRKRDSMIDGSSNAESSPVLAITATPKAKSKRSTSRKKSQRTPKQRKKPKLDTEAQDETHSKDEDEDNEKTKTGNSIDGAGDIRAVSPVFNSDNRPTPQPITREQRALLQLRSPLFPTGSSRIQTENDADNKLDNPRTPVSQELPQTSLSLSMPMSIDLNSPLLFSPGQAGSQGPANAKNSSRIEDEGGDDACVASGASEIEIEIERTKPMIKSALLEDDDVFFSGNWGNSGACEVGDVKGKDDHDHFDPDGDSLVIQKTKSKTVEGEPADDILIGIGTPCDSSPVVLTANTHPQSVLNIPTPPSSPAPSTPHISAAVETEGEAENASQPVSVPIVVVTTPEKNVQAATTTTATTTPMVSAETSTPPQPQATPMNVNGMFLSGRGQRVSVSRNALSNARKMLGDTDDVAQPRMRTPVTTTTSLFSSARGKPVSISRNALNNAKKMMDDVDEAPVGPTGSTTASLFSSGRGKPVSISRNALNNAKKMLDNVDAEDESTPPPQPQPPSSANTIMFSTARGNQVSISKRALSNAKRMLEEDEDDPPTPAAAPPPAVTPAATSGGRVTLSRPQTDTVPENPPPKKARSLLSVKPMTTPTPTTWHLPTTSTALTARPPSTTNHLNRGATSSAAGFRSMRKRTDVNLPSTSKPQRLSVGLSRTRGPVRRRLSFQRPASLFTTPSVVGSLHDEHSRLAEASADAKAKMEATWRESKGKGKSKARVRVRKSLEDSTDEPESIKIPLIDLLPADTGRGRSLPSLSVAELKQRFNLSGDVLSMTHKSASDFRFKLSKGEGEGEGEVGPESMMQLLIESGASPSIVTDRWVENHWSLIVWKLASEERKLPHELAGARLTPQIVLEQLKYRYAVEYSGKRSALRRVLEKDSAASQLMVLCVAGEAPIPSGSGSERDGEGEGADDKSDDTTNARILVTDGWYVMTALLDEPLSERFRSLNKHTGFSIGSKLAVSGAYISGCDGASPLEDAAQAATLHVSFNSTRRARWDAKLGFRMIPSLSVPLGSINVNGGLISATELIVLRRYPIRYAENLGGKDEGKGWVIRGLRAEEREGASHAARMEVIVGDTIEKLRVEKEKERSRSRRGRHSRHHHGRKHRYSATDIQRIGKDGDALLEASKHAIDTSSFDTMLSSSQREVLSAKREAEVADEHQKTSDAIQQAVGASAPRREVIPVMKVLVAGFGSVKSTYVSMWKASEEMWSGLEEGKCFNVCGLVPAKSRSGMDDKEIRLSTTKTTSWTPLDGPSVRNLELCYTPRAPITSECDWFVASKGTEIDVVGVILGVSELNEVTTQAGKETTVYSLFIGDPILEKAIICVSVWGSADSILPSKLEKGTPIVVLNCTYVEYDSLNGIHRLSAFDSAEMSVKIRGKGIPPAVKKYAIKIEEHMTHAATKVAASEWLEDRSAWAHRKLAAPPPYP